MPINKDYDNPHPSRIALHDENAKLDRFFEGPVAMIAFGKEQYLASGTQ